MGIMYRYEESDAEDLGEEDEDDEEDDEEAVPEEAPGMRL